MARIEKSKQWKYNALAAGAIFGMLIGLLMAYLQVRDAEKNQKVVTYDMRSTARFGLTLFDLIKKAI
jgi:uncharacterized membrane-anchored protein YhcB (DUF1043 family)